jgi:hypothetical protein
MTIAAVVEDWEFREALKEIERTSKKMSDRIYDFIWKRGFEVPGTLDDVVIAELTNADTDVKHLKAEVEEIRKGRTHLEGQINTLAKFLLDRGWTELAANGDGDAVDIAIKLIKFLDKKTTLYSVTNVTEGAPLTPSNDYGQELEHRYGVENTSECSECSDGCYTCEDHGGL